MRDARILRGLQEGAWAIVREKLEVICEVIRFHMTGDGQTLEFEEPAEDAHVPRYYGFTQDADADEVLEISDPSDATGKMVAVIPVIGIVAQRMGMLSSFSGGVSTDRLGEAIDEAANNPNVGAILLDVDSPGGSVYGVQELSAKIFKAREKKRIVAVANSLMASAAYHIGSSAEEVYVSPSGEVGSIGVFSVHVDQSENNQAQGFKPTIVRAGKFKAEGNPHEPLSDEAYAHMKQRVDEYYSTFVGGVARNRGTKRSDVTSGMGQGRLVGSAEAMAENMVDGVATFKEVLGALVSGKKVPRRSVFQDDESVSVVATAANQVDKMSRELDLLAE